MLKSCLYSFICWATCTATLAASTPVDSCLPYRQTGSSDVENTKLAGNIPYGEGLLWQISAAPDQSVYLFGTMHSQDRLVTDIPPPVRLRLVQSRTFVMEVLLDENANRVFIDAMYGQEPVLKESLADDIYARLAELAPDYGIAADRLPYLQPWAAFSLVGRPRPVNAPTQDVKLMQIARSGNLDITALETMPELLSSLQGLGLEDQIEILNDTVCNHGDILRQVRELIDLYLVGDLAAIVKVNDEPHHDEAVFERYLQQLLYDRNERMLAGIEQQLQHGDAFIAVGASHLPGERGLLQMLADAGYAVKRIY